MARFQNEDGSKATWWVHINLTAVIGIVALLAVGFVIKYEYDKGKAQEFQDAERARMEREAKDRETAILLAERERDQRDADEGRRKDDKELAKERMALEEQRRRAKQKVEEERLAEIQAQKLQAGKAREAALEEQRKQIQAEREAAAKKAAQLAAEQEAQKKLTAVQLRDEYKSTIKELNDLDDKVKAIERRVIAYRNKSEAAQKQKDGFDSQAQGLTASQSSMTGATVAQPAATTPSSTYSGTAAGGYSSSVITRSAVPTVKVVVDNSDQIAKAQARSDAAAKEQKDSAGGLAAAQADKDAALLAIEAAKSKRDKIAATLKAMGEDVAAKAEPKAQTKAADVPVAGPPKKTFVLKDGRKIVALKVVEAPEEYSVKKEDGKFETIPKDSIEKIVEEN